MQTTTLSGGREVGRINVRKPVILGAVVLGALALLWPMSAFGALASSNRGDVWVDLPGRTSDPGHENDPHLCGPVELYGNGLSSPAGAYTITVWPPTRGAGTVAASGTWVYDQTKGGNQGIAGPIFLAPGHYKVNTDTTSKSKVFWITCVVPTPTTSAPAGSWTLTR
jgi:hypothetical protein